MNKKICLFLVSMLLLCSLAGCAQKVNSTEIKKYADDITEKMLLAQNDDNYANYIENTDSQFKGAVSEEKMKQADKMIRDKIGNYVPGSKQFKDAANSTQNNQKLVAVRYNAKFTNETEDVLVTMIFDDNDLHQVGGIFLNSPKLRQ